MEVPGDADGHLGEGRGTKRPQWALNAELQQNNVYICQHDALQYCNISPTLTTLPQEVP